MIAKALITDANKNRSRLMTVQETAGYLRSSVSTVKELMKSGQLPVVRFGRCVRIDRDDADTLIETAKVTRNGHRTVVIDKSESE